MKENERNSKFRDFVEKAIDLVKLNLLTLLFSLPVVTAGAALTAMDYVLLKIVRNEEGYISRAFFKSFRENLSEGIRIWLLDLAVFALLAIDYYLNRRSVNSQFLQVLILFVGVVFTGHVIYTFAGLSRYSNTVKQTIQNGFLLEFYHLPQTLLILVICVGAAALLAAYFLYLFPFYLLFGLSLPGLAVMRIMSELFQKQEDKR